MRRPTLESSPWLAVAIGAIMMVMAGCQEIDQRPTQQLTDDDCEELAAENGYDDGDLINGACVFSHDVHHLKKPKRSSPSKPQIKSFVKPSGKPSVNSSTKSKR